MMHNKKDSKTSIEARLFALADDMNNVVTREHQILQDELSQISQLVRDAVKSLATNFDDFTRLSMQQTRLMSDLINHTPDTDSEQKHKMAVDLNEKVSDVNKAVMRALQFDDIVQQLTAHSRHRAEQMELLFSSLANKLNDVKTTDQIKIEQIKAVIEAMRDDVAHYRAALEKSNPVKQISVDEGKIELF